MPADGRSGLPSAVVAALDDPPPPRRRRIEAAGISWAIVEWGASDDPPLFLVHGITSSSGTWWRLGPALAASGRWVIAPDQAGHGETHPWRGSVRFRDNAADLAGLVRAAGIERRDLAVVGHSWGAVSVAWLPAAGIRPAVLVLLDPPAIPLPALAQMVEDPSERRYEDIAEARRVVAAANPSWSPRDVEAKAVGLTQFDEAAVRAILLDNGDWDAGLAGLLDPAAQDVPTWVVRGDPAAGGLLPDGAVPAFEERLGSERVITIAGAPHSPHRTHPEATAAALLHALGTPALEH